MSEMMDRCMRAASEYARSLPETSRDAPFMYHNRKGLVAAVIKTMREPTREMLEALLRHRGYDPHADEATLDRLGQMDIATMGVFVAAYRVMVDAAAPPHERSEAETNASTTKG